MDLFRFVRDDGVTWVCCCFCNMSSSSFSKPHCNKMLTVIFVSLWVICIPPPIPAQPSRAVGCEWYRVFALYYPSNKKSSSKRNETPVACWNDNRSRFCLHLIKILHRRLYKEDQCDSFERENVEFSPEHVQSTSDIFTASWINVLYNR